MKITVLDDPPRIRFSVRVQPRSSRSRLAGVHDGTLKVQLQAPPVEGAANAALIGLLARELDVRRRDVRIASGERGRVKTLEIQTDDPGALRDALRSRVAPR